MRARAVIAIAALTAGVHAAPPANTEAVVREALRRFLADERNAGDYAWTRRSQKTEFNQDGSVKTALSTVVRREPYDGFMVSRLVERDGKPLDGPERDRRDAALHRHLGELRSMRPDEREQLAAGKRKKEEQDDAWISEAPAALIFTPAGEQAVAGRPAFAFDVAPRPGYKPSGMRARVFEKLRGRVWIDEADTELARAEIEIFDTVSVGFGLMARVEKGTRLSLQRMRVAGGAWMTGTQRVRAAGRFLLFKAVNEEMVSSYSDYAHPQPPVARGD